jgi:hypothetical protein
MGIFPRGLHRVGVKVKVVLLSDFADLLERLNRAELVVRVHHGDEHGVRADRVAHGFRIDEAARIDGQVGDFDGAAGVFLEELAGVQNCFSSARPVQPFGCHQTVTKAGAKRSKTEQIQKTEIVAILQLAKGFT